MNETIQERKRPVVVSVIVFTLSLALRWHPDAPIPPFDDVYHAKRIANPQILEFDPDRGEHGAFCPWPPLYDEAMRPFGGSGKVPPLFFATFAAAVAFFYPVAGFTVASSPYLIGISSTGHIDHHYVEPLLVLVILWATVRRRGVWLGIAIAVALMVQTALLVAAGLAFIALFLWSGGLQPADGALKRAAPLGFAIAAIAVLIFRLTRLCSYPDSAWFLGYPHAALLTGAAIACALRERVGRILALAAGGAFALAIPSTSAAFLTGVHFFGGDPWLRSIVEFQPMFRHSYEIGTDLANLTGGALLSLWLWRRQPAAALFSTAYLVLAITSRRFLVPAIAIFAVAGALAVDSVWRRRPRRRVLAVIFALATVLPPVAYELYALRTPEPSNEEFRSVGERMRPLPRGRVLAPWSFGHAIDVIGQKPVVIDNFGSMPGERVFTQAMEAMLTTHTESLLRYCRDRNVRYILLPHPAYVPATAATIGIPPDLYSRTRLAGRTVWARLYRGETIRGFTLVSDGALKIWRID